MNVGLAKAPHFQSIAGHFNNLTQNKAQQKRDFSPEALDSFDPSAVKVDPEHPGVAIEPSLRDVYLKRNATQARKNPSVALIMNDPQEFFADLETRFENQKKLTPADPYSFDISDYGIPVLQDIDKALDEEIETLKEKKPGSKRKTGEETGVLAGLLNSAVGAASALLMRKRTRNLDTGIEFLEALKADIGEHLESGEISYKGLNEFGYFSSRALGHFDREDLSWFDRNFLRVDRALLGYKRVSISQEFQRYKDKDFEFFRRRSPVPSTDVVQDAFESAYKNPEKFELASLPVARSLGPGVFMQLVPHDIFLMGVAPEPEAADGFNRPGGDFYLHDARHSSAIFSKRKLYEKHHKVSPAQQAKLEMLQSKWKQEMVQEKRKLKDKELSYAIGFLSFNHHHDRGIPQMPSAFVVDAPGPPSRALYRALKMSGQPIGFQEPSKTIDKAYEWLQDFWLKRLPEEEAVLAASR